MRIRTIENRTKGSLTRRRAGHPHRLPEILIDGIAANSAREGETVQVWQKLALTSDEPNFHRIVEGFDKVIIAAAEKGGVAVPRLEAANQALMVIHADNTADLWVNNLPVVIQAVILRGVKKGEAIYHNDIGDIRGVELSGVPFRPDDKVVCILREAWRFGLFVNFTKQFDVEEMSLELARLYRRMRYAHLFDAVQDQAVFERLVAAGWFPFADIIGGEFQGLLEATKAGWPLDEANAVVVAAFGDVRLDRMLERWLARPHFAAKEPLLRAAISAYKADEPVAVLKIALTEIEGILSEAYKAETGKRAKLKRLLQYAKESAIRKAGAPDSLLLPERFGAYLQGYTFASFDPEISVGSAGSRHAVGHGAATAESYTRTRALQALLTLDQLALAT